MIGFAILIAVCVASGSGQVPSMGKCPRISNVPDFDKQAFLGTWYEVEKYPLFTDIGGRCITNTFEQIDENVMTVTNAQVNRFTKNGSGYVGRITTLGNQEMVISMPLAPFSITVDSPYWIIATDYEHFAVIFSCRQLTSFMSAEMVWIFARTPRPSHGLMEKTYRALDYFKLSKSYLMHTDQANCNHTQA